MPLRPRLVLFDLDGVLADYDRPARCAALARACGADPGALYEAMFGDEGFEHASDRGEIGLPESLRGLRERYGWNIGEACFLDARRLSTRPRPAVLDLCQAVSAQARIAVFTNNGDWVGAHMATIFPELPALFGEAIVCSGQMRRWKPQPEAFHACLARLGDIAPAQALFIDDNADNVEGARGAGLDAFLYTDPAALRAGLHARGFAFDGDDNAT
jgi:putative hydrolase of the HAD superfamily